MKQKVGKFTGAQKKKMREMIGPTYTGPFKTKCPLQETLICLLARFLERAQRGRNKSLWANFVLGGSGGGGGGRPVVGAAVVA
jgi:hypothetical protein